MDNYKKAEKISQLMSQREKIDKEIALLTSEIDRTFRQNFEGKWFSSNNRHMNHNRHMKVVKDNYDSCLCLFVDVDDCFDRNQFSVKIDLLWVDKETVIKWSKCPADLIEIKNDVIKLDGYIDEYLESAIF